MGMTITEKAVEFAVKAHAGAKRKGKTDRPYILHPLEAMLIVSNITNDEEVIAAAVLHDTIEDAKVTKEELAMKFGARVADLVAAESENKREGQSEKATWKIRKQETIDHMKTASRNAKMICLGDKLSNMREIAVDYRKKGVAMWEPFNQNDPKMHAWYYRTILGILAEEFGEIPEIKEYRTLANEVFGE